MLIPVKYQMTSGSLKTTLMKNNETVSSLIVPVIIDKSVASMYNFQHDKDNEGVYKLIRKDPLI
jgi:hypothetical protein